MVLEKTLESPLDSKEIKPVSPKGNRPWIFIGRTDAETEAPILWPPDAKSWLAGRHWCWERLRAGEVDDRVQDNWMASPIQWTWVWANSEGWWWIGKPGVLQSVVSQRVRHNWAAEQQQHYSFSKTVSNFVYGKYFLLLGSEIMKCIKSYQTQFPWASGKCDCSLPIRGWEVSHALLPACGLSYFSHVRLCDPVDSSPPGFSVHRILQKRILEWVALSSSRGFSQPRGWTGASHFSCIGRWVVYHLHHLGSPHAPSTYKEK